MGNTNEKKQKQKEMKNIGTNGYKYDDKQLNSVIQHFLEFGFEEEQIIQAWNKTNCKPDLMLTYLTKNSASNIQQKQEEQMIQQAIELSIQNQSDDYLQNAELYLRTDDPIGLTNLGRTCYFNSFLQTLYHIRELRDPILKIDISENNDNNGNNANNQCDQRNKLKEMLKQFQLTFAVMLKSSKNYADPTNLFEVLKGLSGSVFRQGEENDFWEFQNSTLEYLEQAFMKESDIDTVDLFKSYLHLQSNNSGMFGTKFKRENQNNNNSPIKRQSLLNPDLTNTKIDHNNSNQNNIRSSNNGLDEEFVIFPQRVLSEFVQNQEQQQQQEITNDMMDSNNLKSTEIVIPQSNKNNNEMQIEDINFPSDKTLTLSRQDSNKKRSSKVKNPITELFFGVGEEKITISSKEQPQPEVKIHDIPIGIFNLECKTGDLYSALNKYFNYSVGDYQPEPLDNLSQSVIIKKQKKVDIQLCLKTAPKILNFYINRIHYNTELKSAEKSNKIFTFDKEIYIDNYMKGKDSEFEAQKKQIESIENELASLEAKLLQFDHYNQSNEDTQNNIHILSAFSLVNSYLKMQIQKSDNFIDIQELIEDLNNENGCVDVGVIGQKQALQQQIETLQKYEIKIKENQDRIQNKIKELKEQRQFIQNQNKTIKYELFSILIHQGQANTGHYYCYIYDDKKQCWFKFNDSIVTKVTEEEVLRISYGDQNTNSNACCLFYKNSQTKINPHKPVELSARLKTEVQKRDQPFLERIDEIKIRKKFQEIETDFNKYLKDILNTQYIIQQNKNADNIFLSFLSCPNFKLYMLNQKDDKIKSFGKRLALMEQIDESRLYEFEQQLFKKDNLYKGLSLFYDHMKQTQNVQNQILTDFDKQFYQTIQQQYTNILRYLDQLSQIMNDTKNFPQSFRQLGCLRRSLYNIKSSDSMINLLTNNNQQFVLLKLNVRYIHDVLLLKSCFMIDRYLHQRDLPSAFTLLNILILTYLSFYHVPKNNIQDKISDNNNNSQNNKSQSQSQQLQQQPQQQQQQQQLQQQSNQNQNSASLINTDLLNKSTFESNDTNAFICGQIYNNLKQTYQNFSSILDTDSKSKFDGQLSLIQTPESFPASKQRQISMFEDIEMNESQNKVIDLQKSDIVYKAYDEYEIFIKKQDLWRKQLQYLREKRMYIQQEQRLNQEELYYFE